MISIATGTWIRCIRAEKHVINSPILREYISGASTLEYLEFRVKAAIEVEGFMEIK